MKSISNIIIIKKSLAKHFFRFRRKYIGSEYSFMVKKRHKNREDLFFEDKACKYSYCWDFNMVKCLKYGLDIWFCMLDETRLNFLNSSEASLELDVISERSPI